MTLILQTNTEIINSDAKFLAQDDLIIPGATWFSMDARSRYGWAKGALTGSARNPLTGDLYKNLTEVSPDGTWMINNSGQPVVFTDEGGFDFSAVSTSGSGTYLDIPGFVPNTNSFLISLWINRNALDQDASARGLAGGRLSGVSTATWNISKGTNANNYTLSSGLSSTVITLGTGLMQLALSVVFAGGNWTHKAYLNGAQSGAAATGSGTIHSGVTANNRLGNTANGQNRYCKIHRFVVEDLTLSGRNPDAAIAEAWETNRLSFT